AFLRRHALLPRPSEQGCAVTGLPVSFYSALVLPALFFDSQHGRHSAGSWLRGLSTAARAATPSSLSPFLPPTPPGGHYAINRDYADWDWLCQASKREAISC